MVTTPVTLTNDEMAALRDLAEREGVPVEHVIRRGISAVLHAADATAGDRRRRAASTIGAFRSGWRDVSERHDHYLAEANGECESS